MAMCLITYDLHAPHRDYEPLLRAIRALGDACHTLKSVWIVASGYSASEIRQKLERLLDGDDQLLVVEVSDRKWSQVNLDAATADWFERMK